MPTIQYRGHPSPHAVKTEVHKMTNCEYRKKTLIESESLFNFKPSTYADAWRRNAHIFDGKTITKETAAFQLCDITDPMLKAMIDDPDALRETCNVS
jgi:hypothetical protein